MLDAAAEKGDFAAIERWLCVAILMQGARIAVPAAALCFIDPCIVTDALNAMPKWSLVVWQLAAAWLCWWLQWSCVMATHEVWPFFALVFAAINQLTLIALGVISVCLAILYVVLKTLLSRVAGASENGSGDPARRYY